MRNRIAGISTQSQDEQLDEESLHERIADEHCRLSALERRRRSRMARRKQVRFMRRIMRMAVQGASTRDWAT
ncbi:MAG: hypothetical protein RLZZ21_1385 [Planctomycetota bacterium]|jgi:hypothetical protein